MKIPEAALQQHIAVLGKTGSGKTYASKSAIVEPLLAAGARVGVVDPTGAWWGLRSSRDGKGPGFPVLILGGDHGDLPLPALGGAAVARLLTEQGVNLVADTSQFTVGERTRWFIDFANTVHRVNRSPLHLVLDEAHNFAPQGKVIDPDAGKMLHAANRLAAEGRSRGIRLTMITQRPQKLHKDTLTSADTLIALRVLAPHDRAAVEDWIKGCGDLAQGKEVLNSLASLQRGEGWIWYPEGSYLKRATFGTIKTFDSSATPTGGVIAAPKAVAEIDLTEIKSALADAVREAEANDPKLLRAEIAKLRKLADVKPAAPAAPDPAALEAAELRGYQRGQQEALQRAVEAVQTIAGSAPAPRQAPAPQPRAAAPAAAAEGVSRSQQRILDSLAALESMGIAQPSRNQLALWADVSPTSGGYFNNLGGLRSAGMLDYPAPSTVALTEAGRSFANHAPPPSVEQMQEAVCAKVGASKAAILRALIDLYPGDIGKDDLAERIGVSPTSGGYFNNLGALRTLGLIDYPSPGRVAALPVLFLD